MKNISGFTLLEILITLALIGLITAALFPSLYHTSRLVSRSQETFSRIEDNRTAEALIRRLLSAIIIPGKTENNLRFDGNSHMMRFLVVDSLFDGPAVVELKATVTGATQQLALNAYSIEKHNEKITSLPVFNDFKTITFEYFGQDKLKLTKSWQTNWLSESPPALVSMIFEPLTGPLYRLDTAVPVTGAYFCDYDSVSRQCR